MMQLYQSSQGMGLLAEALEGALSHLLSTAWFLFNSYGYYNRRFTH